MASKYGSTSSNRVSQLSDRETEVILAEWKDRVLEAAQAFQRKVEREAPACFQPSKELKELFDVLDEEF